MLEALLKEHSGELLGALTGGAGLETSEAESLLPPALSGIGDVIGSGDLDLTSLLGGGGDGVSALLQKLNIAEIASSAGIEEGRAQSGLSSLIPVALSLLGDKAGGAEGILGMLGGSSGSGGGALGALGGIASKLFGK